MKSQNPIPLPSFCADLQVTEEAPARAILCNHAGRRSCPEKLHGRRRTAGRYLRRTLILAAMLLSCALVSRSSAQVPVTINVNPQVLLRPIPSTFQGLSFEAGILPANSQGGHFFSPSNSGLIQLFKSMGVKSLRLGGSSVDQYNPGLVLTNADLDSLFQFAKAAGVKVIFSFRLQNASANNYAYVTGTAIPQANYILSNYASSLDCFALGNEPNQYLGSFSSYFPAWKNFYNQLVAQCPTATVCGPSSWPAGESFAVSMSGSVAGLTNFSYITQHEYPFGSSSAHTNVTTDLATMLGTNQYSSIYNLFVPSALAANLAYRIEETNSYSVGGVNGASNSYAAALWGLDYQYWCANNQASGLNFHAGSMSPNLGFFFNYSPFTASYTGANTTSITAQGLAYGLLAFAPCASGTMVSSTTSITTGTGAAFNLTSYAVAGKNNATYVTIINKDYANGGRSASATVNLPSGYVINTAMAASLLQQTGSVGSDTNITFGNGSINSGGNWTGSWSSLPSNDIQANQLNVTVPPASAMVLQLSTTIPMPGPSNLTAMTLSDSQVGLNWVNNDISATSYSVAASVDNVNWVTLASNLSTSAGVTSIGSNVYRYVASGLAPATQYYLRVNCTDSTGTSAYSNTATATTGATIGDGIPGWWRLQYFQNGLTVIPGQSGPLDNPSGNGVSNLLEYATGNPPTGPVSQSPVVTVSNTNSHMTISFHRVDPPTLNYSVDSSQDLKNWTTIANLPAGTETWMGPAPAATPVLESGSGVRTVTVTDPVSTSAYNRRFLRLRVFPTSVSLTSIPDARLFLGGSTHAFRDPAAFYYDGTFYLYYTYTSIQNGLAYWQTAWSKSTDLIHWTAPVTFTPLDLSKNYCSPGCVTWSGSQFILCLQSYPTNGGLSSYGSSSSNIYYMTSPDLENWSPMQPAVSGTANPPPALPGLLVNGPGQALTRTIDSYLFSDLSNPAKIWCFYKQNGNMGKSYSTNALQTWTAAGTTGITGENPCVIEDVNASSGSPEYVLLYSITSGSGTGMQITRSTNLTTWTPDPSSILLNTSWKWTSGRLSGGFLLDMRNDPGVGKAIMFYAGSSLTEANGGFSQNVNLGIAWSADLKIWNYPPVPAGN